MRRISQRICGLILAFLLCFLQYGCRSSTTPPNSVLIDALELQVKATKSSLDDLLSLEESFVEILGVKVESSSYMESPGGRLLSVTGHVDCIFPGSREKINSSFQLFLERGEKGESWRLAKPSITSNGLSREWLTYPLPI